MLVKILFWPIFKLNQNLPQPQPQSQTESQSQFAAQNRDRLTVLNAELDLNWLNLSLIAFKLKIKEQFLMN